MSLLQPSQVAIDNLQNLVIALTSTANSLRGLDRNKDGKISFGEISMFAAPFLIAIFKQIQDIDFAELSDEAKDIQATEIVTILKSAVEQLEFFQPAQKTALYDALDLVKHNLVFGPAVVSKLNAAF